MPTQELLKGNQMDHLKKNDPCSEVSKFADLGTRTGVICLYVPAGVKTFHSLNQMGRIRSLFEYLLPGVYQSLARLKKNGPVSLHFGPETRRKNALSS